jgi:hypothetical protein
MSDLSPLDRATRAAGLAAILAVTFMLSVPAVLLVLVLQ